MSCLPCIVNRAAFFFCRGLYPFQSFNLLKSFSHNLQSVNTRIMQENEKVKIMKKKYQR